MTPLLRFRDQITAEGVVPRWLRGFYSMPFLYSIGVHIDWLADLLVDGVLLRFPGQCAGASPYISRDRSMIRGPEETEAQFAERARWWQQDARIKGSPVSVLRQLQAFLTPHAPRIRLVTNRGRYIEISTTGTISWGDMAWNWDGNTNLNTRFWVLIWPPATLWQNDGVFSSPGLIGDGGVIGSTASRAMVLGVQHVIRECSSDNSRHMGTIVIFNDALWQTQQPDGTWNRQDRRNPSASYWPGES